MEHSKPCVACAHHIAAAELGTGRSIQQCPSCRGAGVIVWYTCDVDGCNEEAWFNAGNQDLCLEHELQHAEACHRDRGSQCGKPGCSCSQEIYCG